MSADPFGTAVLRDHVLSTWRASPDRFREDANAEEDLALGGYRDRLVVELAQNAADAAARAGVPGRLLLRLARTDDGDLLVAANTGDPLDAAGVRALSSLRASAKRDADPLATVGRFGVGFAAVLAVTDEPAVVSHGRGVRFSRADSAARVHEVAAEVPELAREVDRRDGHVPVLRLPFPAEGLAPSGYDTAVLLPLRDGAAADLATHLLQAVDDALLLALPALGEIAVELPGAEPVVLSGVTQRWHGVRREGVHPPEVLADRPTEERERAGWTVTWALPAGAGGDGVTRVLHAPTPTDEPLDWTALLVATFPLDPSRRHVAPGPASDALVAHSAEAYADLLHERAEAGDDVLTLVPTGLPAGSLDAALREAVLDLLPGVPLLPSVEDGTLLRPRDAVCLDGLAGEAGTALTELATVVASLVPAPRRHLAALRALGVRRLALADVVEELPADPSPRVWARRYAALAGLLDDTVSREALASLPMPLADGRVVRGVRGTLLLPGEPDAATLAPLARLGLRVVHPDVASSPEAARALERLGARPADPRSLLEDPGLRAAVEDGADDLPAEVVDALLGVVRAAVRTARLEPGDLPWLSELPLPAEDGDTAPAGALVVPGSVAAEVLDGEEVLAVAPDVLERWGADVLEAVGVARTLTFVHLEDVDTEDLPDELDVLDGARGWAAGLPSGTVAEVTAVRDLDVTRPDAWPQVLDLLARDPRLRRTVTEPVVVRDLDGATHRRAPYTAWWLRDRLRLAGCADPEASGWLHQLLPPAPEWVAGVDATVREALGPVRRVEDLDDDAWAAVLAALVDREPPVAVVLEAVAALATAPEPPRCEPPERLRVPGAAGGTVVVDADDVAVADAPMWWQRRDVGPLLPAPAGAAERLADVLDVELASERAAGVVAGAGAEEDVPVAVLALLPGAPRRWRAHDVLTVDGVDVDWWVEGDGPEAVVHATTMSGLARGLAQACGRWAVRLAVEAVLVEPDRADEVTVEEAWG